MKLYDDVRGAIAQIHPKKNMWVGNDLVELKFYIGQYLHS